MTELTELAERCEDDAADCARWAREARANMRAAAGSDPEQAERWKKAARMWAGQARQLRRDAASLRAHLGDKPPVGIRGHTYRAAGSKPPRKL